MGAERTVRRWSVPGTLRAGLAALLAVATLAVFWPATANDFVPYDDPVYVTKNKHVLAGLSREGFRWSLEAHEGGSWHPLTWWSHMLDVQLFGTSPAGHHATSVVLHAAAATALFLLLSGLTGSPWPAFVVAGLFALHPLHVESVAWVSERKDVLAALFWLLALGAWVGHLRCPRPARYLFALALFALALMSKPMAVTFPLALLLLDFWPLGRIGAGRGGRRRVARLLVEKTPFLLLAAAVSLLTIVTQAAAGALEPLGEVPAAFRMSLLSLRAMNVVHSYAVYLGQALLPVDLAVFYPHPAHALVPWRAAAAAAALLLVSAAVLAPPVRLRFPYLATGWLWYVVTLLPVSGVLQVGSQAHADRYTYLPLTGVFILVAWAGRELARRLAALRPALAALAAAALVGLAWGSLGQIAHWRDGYTLFSRALAATTGNYLAHQMLGDIQRERGAPAAAEGQYREALRLAPLSSGLHNRLGLALTSQGRLEEAAAEYREAARIDPGNVEALNNLGVHLSELGRPREAEAHLRDAVRLRPGSAEIHANLGDALAGQGRMREAALAYRRALALKPGLAPVEERLERLQGQWTGGS